MHIFGANLDAHGNAFDLPLAVLEARGEIVAVVDAVQETAFPARRDAPHRLGHRRALVLVLPDRHDDDLNRRQSRRKDQAVVVRVGHDQRADQARGGAPRRSPGILLAVIGGGVLDVERAREVLAQVMARPGLQRLAVLHHRLDRVGAKRAGELFALGLEPAQHRQRHHLLHEIRVDVMQDHQRLALGVRLVGVHRVTLLPQELNRAQEGTWTQLPAHDVGPLIDQQWQIAPRAHPLCEGCTDDRLGRGPHHQRLGQLLATGTRDLGHFGREALDMLGLLHQEAFGNEQRKVGVLRARLLDPLVKSALDSLPDRVAVRLDHHAAAHRRVFAQPRLIHDV